MLTPSSMRVTYYVKLKTKHASFLSPMSCSETLDQDDHVIDQSL